MSSATAARNPDTCIAIVRTAVNAPIWNRSGRGRKAEVATRSATVGAEVVEGAGELRAEEERTVEEVLQDRGHLVARSVLYIVFVFLSLVWARLGICHSAVWLCSLFVPFLPVVGLFSLLFLLLCLCYISLHTILPS